MRRRDMSEAEHLELRRMWPDRKAYPIKEVMRVLGCSPKTLARFVREAGMDLRKPNRKSVPSLPRCQYCGRRTADRKTLRCRICFDRRRKLGFQTNPPILIDANGEKASAPPRQLYYRCVCGGRATSPAGHPGCTRAA